MTAHPVRAAARRFKDHAVEARVSDIRALGETAELVAPGNQCVLDDEHSSRRRARDRCIDGAVRESVQLEVGVEVRQRCFQRQSISRGRAIQCLPTFARMTGSKRRRTHIARRGRSMGATVRDCHAAPMQSRKQASAGPTRDAWFATPGPVAAGCCLRVGCRENQSKSWCVNWSPG